MDITESWFTPQEDDVKVRSVVEKFGRWYGHFVPEIAVWLAYFDVVFKKGGRWYLGEDAQVQQIDFDIRNGLF